MEYASFNDAAIGLNTSACPVIWLDAIRLNPGDPDGARQAFLELGGEYIAGHPEGPLPSKRDAQSALEMLRRILPHLPITRNLLTRIEAFVEQVEEVQEGPGPDTFYMVYAEGGYPPTKRHAAAHTAQAEAERIARKNNQPTYVLEAIGKVVPTVEVVTQPLRITPTNVVPFGPGYSPTEFVANTKVRTAA